ncbi:hypothetical protein ACFY1U_01255 [Streptomyces sp. NPDC001351]|uniref:hypothetical protein n=1 Tax=Streptomyces sp. NPDC001351 TaxID=3364564 RepID=UPI00368530A9
MSGPARVQVLADRFGGRAAQLFQRRFHRGEPGEYRASWTVSPGGGAKSRYCRARSATAASAGTARPLARVLGERGVAPHVAARLDVVDVDPRRCGVVSVGVL